MFNGILLVSHSSAVFVADSGLILTGFTIMSGWESDDGFLLETGDAAQAQFHTQEILINSAPFFSAMGVLEPDNAMGYGN